MGAAPAARTSGRGSRTMPATMPDLAAAASVTLDHRLVDDAGSGDASAATSRRVDGVVLRDDEAPRASSELVAEETAIAVEVNGISHAVMLATPADLDDFAVGFLLGEGIVTTAADVLDVEWASVHHGDEAAVALRVRVTQRAQARLAERRRTMAGRTGCGLCGTDSLSEALRPAPRVPARAPLERDALFAGMAALGSGQRLQRATGATHAAAWLDRAGRLQLLREDVGRHNALDKLVGALARQGLDPAAGFAAVTSRASYEMVQKVACAGIAHLAAISAPTGLAVRLAARSGVTLAGFARGRQVTLYANPDGVATASPA